MIPTLSNFAGSFWSYADPAMLICSWQVLAWQMMVLQEHVAGEHSMAGEAAVCRTAHSAATYKRYYITYLLELVGRRLELWWLWKLAW